jgi:hypothetical protein
MILLMKTVARCDEAALALAPLSWHGHPAHEACTHADEAQPHTAHRGQLFFDRVVFL